MVAQVARFDEIDSALFGEETAALQRVHFCMCTHHCNGECSFKGEFFKSGWQ